VQVTASLNVTQNAPDIAQLTQPVVTITNVAFFDFATGTNALVTLTSGGNADLAPERRRVSTVGATWKPMKARELRLALNYIETRIDDQTVNIVRGSPALLAAFPERFRRDADGQLLTADLRPINVAFERERKLEGRINLWTPLGAAPKPPAAPAGSTAPPPPQRQRPSLYSFVTATLRLDDQVRLRPGQPVFDALDGDGVSSVQERSRFEAQGAIGGSVGAVQGGIFGLWKSTTRIRSDIPSADLRFSPRMFFSLYSTFDAAKLAPKADWTKRMTLQFTVQNLFNNRVQVRDRSGATPYAFQPSFLDWYGRIAKLSVRKLF
jgi:iron complex outermembrane recepter protein